MILFTNIMILFPSEDGRQAVLLSQSVGEESDAQRH